MNNNWRQVRIFTSDFSDQWYFGLLAAFAVPFAAKYPETPFWFTRYTGDRKRGEQDDAADTTIVELKDLYLNAAQEHRSLRFRFCLFSDEEAFLEALFTNKFWCSGFLPFNTFVQFGTGRFGSDPDIDSRLKRASAVAQLLYANCLYVLDVFQQRNGAWSFEPSADGLNRFSANTFQTMIHLMAQVMGKNGHEPLPLFWQDPNNQHNFIPTSIT